MSFAAVKLIRRINIKLQTLCSFHNTRLFGDEYY